MKYGGSVFCSLFRFVFGEPRKNYANPTSSRMVELKSKWVSCPCRQETYNKNGGGICGNKEIGICI
jgi:hypothetical protein